MLTELVYWYPVDWLNLLIADQAGVDVPLGVLIQRDPTRTAFGVCSLSSGCQERWES